MASEGDPRRGRFVDEHVDTSGFTFWEGSPAIAGAPGLGEDEEQLRLDTLHSLVKISDTDDPVLMSMCRLVRSILRVPVAGEPQQEFFLKVSCLHKFVQFGVAQRHKLSVGTCTDRGPQLLLLLYSMSGSRLLTWHHSYF